MSSAEGQLAGEEKDNIKLRLKIKLTKSGGFVSISDSANNKGFTPPVDRGDGQLRQKRKHTEDERCESSHAHKTFRERWAKDLAGDKKTQKKERKKKLKDRQVGGDQCTQPTFTEACDDFGASDRRPENHNLYIWSSKSDPCSQLKLLDHDISIEPLHSIPPTDVEPEFQEISAMDARLNLSSSSEDSDVVQIFLYPDIHKTEDAVDNDTFLLSAKQPVSSPFPSVGSEYSDKGLDMVQIHLRDEDINEPSVDGVDSHYCHPQVAQTVLLPDPGPSSSDSTQITSQQEEETRSGWTVSLSGSIDTQRVTGGRTLAAVSCVENIGDVPTPDSEINNNQMDHDGGMPASLYGRGFVLRDQVLMVRQTDINSYPQMLLNSNLAEFMESATGNVAFTTFVKSVSSQPCKYADEGEGEGHEPEGIMMNIQDPRSSGASDMKTLYHRTDPCHETPAVVSQPEEPTHKEEAGGKDVTRKGKTARCRCRHRVLQRSSAELQPLIAGKAGGSWEICGKCNKQFPRRILGAIRNPDKRPKTHVLRTPSPAPSHPGICCLSGIHKPFQVYKEHPYCLTRVGEYIGTTFKSVGEAFFEDVTSEITDTPETADRSEGGDSTEMTAEHTFPPKPGFTWELAYRVDQNPEQTQNLAFTEENQNLSQGHDNRKFGTESVRPCHEVFQSAESLSPTNMHAQDETVVREPSHNALWFEQNGSEIRKDDHVDRRKRHRQQNHLADSDSANLDTHGLDPCYVVLERLPSAIDGCVAVRPPCPRHCRAESLDFLCEYGKLTQCKHCVAKLSKRSPPDPKHQGVSNFLRHNKTLEGYEEYRQQQLHKIRRQRNTGPSDQSLDSSMGVFFPLSSLFDDGTTNLSISNSNIKVDQRCPDAGDGERGSPSLQSIHGQEKRGVSAQPVMDLPTEDRNYRITRNMKARLNRADASHKSLAADATNEPMRRLSSDPKQKPGTVDAHPSVSMEDYNQMFPEKENEQLKMSKVDVKYYVFEASRRAFVVPLIRSSCRANSVNKLDEEDLMYVKMIIGILLEEKSSCARHLGYQQSMRLKKKGKNGACRAGVWDEEKHILGGSVEKFRDEWQKMVASNPQVLSMVPQNNKVGELEYLQQIGEDVYAYLRGGTEDVPPWIKELAKKIFHRLRRRMWLRKKLKPSKDVTIEIDYAQEDADIDVGDEEGGYMKNSEASAADAETEPAFEAGSADSSFGTVSDFPLTEPMHQATNDSEGQQTGSFVSEEAYVQEQKPLLSELIQASQTTNSGFSSESGKNPHQGHHVNVPLPPGFQCLQTGMRDLSHHISVPVVSQPSTEYTSEAQDTCEPMDRKPLAHELLPFPSIPVPLPEACHLQEHPPKLETQATEQQHKQATEKQNPGWPHAVVKQEPPDDDFSCALSGGMPKPPVSDSSSRPQNAFPFITNDTFGKGVVQIEQETPDVEEENTVQSEQLSVETKSSHPEPKLSQLSPWMVPDVDPSAVQLPAREAGLDKFPTRLMFAERRYIVIRAPHLGVAEARAADIRRELHGPVEEDAECDDEDEEEMYTDSDGNHSQSDDDMAEEDSSGVMPVISDVCGADSLKHLADDSDNEDSGEGSLPVIAEVFGANTASVNGQTVAVDASCGESWSVTEGGGLNAHTAAVTVEESATALSSFSGQSPVRTSDGAGLLVIAEVVSSKTFWSEELEGQQTDEHAPLAHGQHISVPFTAPDGGTFSAENKALGADAAFTAGYFHVAQGCETAVIKQEPVSPAEETAAEYPDFPSQDTNVDAAEPSVASVNSCVFGLSTSDQWQEPVLCPPFSSQENQDHALGKSLLSTQAASSQNTRLSTTDEEPKKTSGQLSCKHSKVSRKMSAPKKRCLPPTLLPEVPVESVLGGNEGAMRAEAPSPLLLCQDDAPKRTILTQSPVDEIDKGETSFQSSQNTSADITPSSLVRGKSPIDSEEQPASPLPPALDDYSDRFQSMLPSFSKNHSPLKNPCLCAAGSENPAAAPISTPASKKRKPAKKGSGHSKKSRAKKKAPASSTSASSTDPPRGEETCAISKRPLSACASTKEDRDIDMFSQSGTDPSPAKKRKDSDPQTPSSKVSETEVQKSPSVPSVKRVTTNLNSFLEKLQKTKKVTKKGEVVEGTTSVSCGETLVAPIEAGDEKPEAKPSRSSKSVHERSFVDCLPKEFLSAWNS